MCIQRINATVTVMANKFFVIKQIVGQRLSIQMPRLEQNRPHGNRWGRIASAAGSSINRLPEVETITGSSTTLVTSYFFNNPAIATTDASVGNIPNFTASTPISSNTAAICAATISAAGRHSFNVGLYAGTSSAVGTCDRQNFFIVFHGHLFKKQCFG